MESVGFTYTTRAPVSPMSQPPGSVAVSHLQLMLDNGRKCSDLDKSSLDTQLQCTAAQTPAANNINTAGWLHLYPSGFCTTGANVDSIYFMSAVLTRLE